MKLLSGLRTASYCAKNGLRSKFIASKFQKCFWVSMPQLYFAHTDYKADCFKSDGYRPALVFYISEVSSCLHPHYFREHYEKTLHLLQLWRHRGGQQEATWWRLVCCLERLQDTQILEDVKRYLMEKEERAKCRVTGKFGPCFGETG